VESFKETLELGLQKPEQIVVRAIYPILEEHNVSGVTVHCGVAVTSAESPMGLFTSAYSEGRHCSVSARHDMLWQLCPIPASSCFCISEESAIVCLFHFHEITLTSY
jgi:hypothetical protein